MLRNKRQELAYEDCIREGLIEFEDFKERREIYKRYNLTDIDRFYVEEQLQLDIIKRAEIGDFVGSGFVTEDDYVVVASELLGKVEWVSEDRVRFEYEGKIFEGWYPGYENRLVDKIKRVE